MMKKILTLLLLLVFLVSCQTGEKYSEEDLPPTPPLPGGKAIYGVGLAASQAIPPWAMPAKNMDLSSKESFPDKTITLSIANFEAIYGDAYYFNKKTRAWEKLSLFGTEKQGDWLKGSAVANLKLSLDKFDYGENHLVVYACNKLGKKWMCNNNKWMIISFNLKEKPTGTAPTEQAVKDLVIAANIDPFILKKTISEEDNFEEILVMRYDAEYFEPETELNVKAMIFDVRTQGELKKSLNTMFKDIINKGFKEHKGQNIAVYLDMDNARNAMWTSGKKLIFIQTFTPEFASRDIIDAYLEKYPSDLTKV